MQSVGRNAQEQRAFEAQLTVTHEFRATVKLLDLDGVEKADLTDRLIEGQVNIDADSETDRQATFTVYDPDHSLALDSDAPDDGGLFVDRMVQALYGVRVTSLGKWIDVPVFTGPITGMSRDVDQIALTCLGKEHLAKGHAWRTQDFRKGSDTVAVIKALLRERAGETLFAFPDTSQGKLGDKLSLGLLSQPWPEAATLASSIQHQLFYDGAGVCRLRPLSGQPRSWTFSTGDGGSVLTRPSVSYDLSTVSNTVRVVGRKAGKKSVTASAIAPPSHPLSPGRLGRKDAPRYLVTEISNDKLRTVAACRATADRELARLLKEGLEVTFDALPIPHLDPLDSVRVVTDEVTLDFTLRKASIPLVHSGVMSVGTNKNVSPDLTKIRPRP